MSDNERCDVPRVTLGFLRSQEENRRFLVKCQKNPEENQSSNLEEARECDGEGEWHGVWKSQRDGAAE